MSVTTADSKWMSASAVAAELGVSDQTIYDLAHAGELASMRVGVGGKVMRISRASFTAYIERQQLLEAPHPTPRRGRKSTKG